MNLKASLEQELDKLADAAGPQDLRFNLSVEQGEFHCELAAVDSLASSIRQITYRSSRLADASISQLREIGDRLAERISYLLEPLAALECDEQLKVAQLRSAPPQRDADHVAYFELLIGPEQLSLCRYGKAKAESRRAIDATLTRETLVRLAQDLVSAV